MIYWLEKLKWRIRKFLGIKNNKLVWDMKLLIKITNVVALMILAQMIGINLARLWWWFFPRVIRAPMEYL